MASKEIHHIAKPLPAYVKSLELDPRRPRVWSPLRVQANTVNAPPELLNRITWTVRLDGVPIQESVSVFRNMLKIACIPNEWFEKQVEVSAAFPGQEPVFRSFIGAPRISSTTEVTRCEIAEYVALVRKVETAYPTLGPEGILGALRRHAGVALGHFQDVLTGSPESPPQRLEPTDDLTAADIARMEALSEHKDSGGGVAEDNIGTRVALGHVLIGMAAGMHRRPTTTVHAWKLPIPTDCDSLLFVTIAGDLGQSAATSGAGAEHYIGDDTEATYPELVGDIDGVILGSRVTASPGSMTTVSKVLQDYYCASANTKRGITANQRFRNYASLRSPTMEADVLAFANSYYRGTHLARSVLMLPNTLFGNSVSPTAVSAAIAEFDAWCRSMLARGIEQEQNADATDAAYVAQGFP